MQQHGKHADRTLREDSFVSGKFLEATVLEGQVREP